MDRKKYNRLKVVLAEKSTTNKMLADNLGVKPQTVSNWVTNAKQPPVWQLFEIAKSLGVEAKDLLSLVKDV